MKTSPFTLRLTVMTLAILAWACAWTGCMSRPHLDKQTFSFSAPDIAPITVVVGDRALGIRLLQIAPPFDGRSLVYRTGDFTYVRDPYAEFLDSPADEMMAPVRGWLRKEGFAAVVESGSALTPNTLVEIHVTQLYGDFRRSHPPAAVVTLRLLLLEAPNGVPGKAIHSHPTGNGKKALA